MYESERKNGTAGQKVLEEGEEPFSFPNQSDEIKCQPPSSFLCPSISINPFIRASIHCHAVFTLHLNQRTPLAFHLVHLLSWYVYVDLEVQYATYCFNCGVLLPSLMLFVFFSISS